MVGWRFCRAVAGRGSDFATRPALIHLHMVADVGGFADDRAGAVVHEEVRADLRAGEGHAGAAMGPFGHDARISAMFADIIRARAVGWRWLPRTDTRR